MATYQQIGNIKGARGATGPTGPKGATGATGPQGPKGDSPTSSEIQTAIKTVMKTLTWGSLAS
ncbi:hypothetical protein BSAE_0276 [Bifidobacterium pullorum subsp. saeculare DSM 6531 = LMG 14934]|uniref:Collagen-like protein n=1 Tax=Bifidobacterium pullorum subsp. saeculare DSM 6531 = LMG 14934 TaxID=1437611 RepID=A0A087D095_9BIFI|nr:hypothetical protein [Bifidobacterium pullorum]KFI88945.1 hypothetical protein BSAE_0276 [Bifidobacterium pullorum subsp. saeculare DSM 6531 = LMG 14934]